MPPKKRKQVTDVGDDYSEENERLNSHWHISRGVPVAFIITMSIYALSQVGLMGWFGSSMNSRVEAIEKAQATLMPTASNNGERLTRLEEKVGSVQETVRTGFTDVKAILAAQDSRDRLSTTRAKQ